VPERSVAPPAGGPAESEPSQVGDDGLCLSSFTTLRLGGPADRFVTAATSDGVIDAVRQCDSTRTPLLLLGGGSNLVVADEGFRGTVVRVATSGVEVQPGGPGSVELRVAAGQEWDAVVRQSVAEGWVGVEALSGIPGSTGATPMQNVGAYGQDVSQTVVAVRAWDRQDTRVRTLGAADCEFAYRSSRLKLERFRGGPRFVVLEVTFRLEQGAASAPVGYAELARALGVQVGERAEPTRVREAVLGLRRGKGMVLSDDDPDTFSAGSFFTNPVLPAEQAVLLPEGAPRWPAGGGPAGDGQVKTSAAWLIEHAGFGKGFGLPGPVSLSTKHTLALTNRGSASTAELLALARQVRDGVRTAFGVELAAEPALVGCSL
jgi:UDP-N-acetylmuramate dehydrogenase